MPLNDGTANFNFYLNRQGIRGRKGEKGDPGVPVTVEVGQNTSNTFTLLITTVDGTYETPNLRGSLINTAGQGIFLMYDAENDSIYTGDAPSATDEVVGVVRIATQEEIEARDGEGVVTASQLADILVGNDVVTALPITKISSTAGNYAGFTIDEENATKTPTVGLYNTGGFTARTITFTPISGGKFGANAAGTGFDSGNIYIEFPFEEGKLVGGIDRTYIQGASPAFIFGNTDGTVFTPLYIFKYTNPDNFTRVLSFGKIASFTDTSITVETLYSYIGTQTTLDDVGNMEYPVGLISLKQGTDNAIVEGLFTKVSQGQSGITRALFTNQTIDMTNDELLTINSVRMYPCSYQLSNCTTPLAYTVMGTKEGGVSTISNSADIVSIGTYELGVVQAKRLTLKYDSNTMGLTGAGALYAKTGTVDSSLSTVSENPVQNKVITTNINSITGDISTLQTNVGNLQTTIDGGEV